MKKIFFLLLVTITVIQACNNKEQKGKFTVTGDLKNTPDQKVYLEQLFFSDQAPEVLDTADVKNGKFSVAANAAEEGIFRLRLEKQNNGYLFINDNASIGFTADTKDQTINGATFNSPANTALKNFLTGLDTRRTAFEKTANRIKELELHSGNDSALTAEKQQMSVIEKEANDFIIKTVDKAESPVVAIFALGYTQHTDTALTGKSVAALKNKFPSHSGVAAMVARYQQSANPPAASKSAPANKTGSSAPDFTMNDTEGKPFTLSQLRGKYVLVDFWASWCGPCRGENPNVVAAFNKYKTKNFTILGVSLDDDKAAWLKAIKDDKLDWKHVSDLKGWYNATVSLYGYEGIPYNVLLDPEGKIIATELRGAALDSKLAEVIK